MPDISVSVPVPRDADGRVDIRALSAELQRCFANGATEIRVASLTQLEARQLLLVSDRNLLVHLGSLLPRDGVKRQVRFRGEVEARVQRNEAGALSARAVGINLGELSAVERATLVWEIAESGDFERLRFRGTGADGARVRAEFRR